MHKQLKTKGFVFESVEEGRGSRESNDGLASHDVLLLTQAPLYHLGAELIGAPLNSC